MMLAVGLIIGTLLALAASRAVTSLLFGLQPHDPASVAVAFLALSAVGLAASYLPATRAGRVAPVTALRQD